LVKRIEGFLDECRADPWFKAIPNWSTGSKACSPNSTWRATTQEWQAIRDQLGNILVRTTDTPVDRCQALAEVLQTVRG
jgi:hypothetical protein